jgi:hypothetical protein
MHLLRDHALLTAIGSHACARASVCKSVCVTFIACRAKPYSNGEHVCLIAGVGMVDTGSNSSVAHTAAQRSTHSADRNSSSSSSSNTSAMRRGAAQMSHSAPAGKHNRNSTDADNNDDSSSESSVDSEQQIDNSSNARHKDSSSGSDSSSAAKAASSTKNTTDYFEYDDSGSVQSSTDSNDEGT